MGRQNLKKKILGDFFHYVKIFTLKTAHFLKKNEKADGNIIINIEVFLFVHPSFKKMHILLTSKYLEKRHVHTYMYMYR